jgi:malonyl-ACP decarboxylase
VDAHDVLVTGVGVVCANGLAVPEFLASLRFGRAKFGYLARAGRCGPRPFLGAEIPAFSLCEQIRRHAGQSVLAARCERHRRLSWSGQLAMLATLQAWMDAGLPGADVSEDDIADTAVDGAALIVAGSNLHQREMLETCREYAHRIEYVRPTHGVGFFDTDLVGVISESFGLHGEGCAIGGASASGNLAIAHGARLVRHGEAPLAVVVGACTDLSAIELQALAGLGALGSRRFAEQPERACRPFDRDSDGFIYGEGSGCLILESREHARRRGASVYGEIAGAGVCLAGDRTPEPSLEHETRAMRLALRQAGVSPEAVDYVNTHGTGSTRGDAIELAAIRGAGLGHARLNATKSLTGHLLSAAGVVECIATLLQMQEGFLHPTRNLDRPIDPDLAWVAPDGESADVRVALSNSFGFAGINSSIVVRATSID